ncbi:hypothetical protein NPX13_g5271 [Xylaria arbuscula]|uniref:Heterokaryon incompatibility domain-containing protein n=1 Tax=Xylaria arbuscula TaxID=114810 RepID=A0A9W8NEQ1_9PEZI|nr:hypothetical protein NPX13_g5271 [Xylaria arbuscula]
MLDQAHVVENKIVFDQARLLWHASTIWPLVRDLGSAIPQDKIFGLYAISTRFGLGLPQPDYSKSAAEVFEFTTRTIIQQTSSLRILTQCIRDAPVTENLPSWVPDWAMKTQQDLRLYEASGILHGRYKAGGYNGVISSPTATTGRLNLRCLFLGKVSFLAVSSKIRPLKQHCEEYPIFGRFSKACHSWCQRASLSGAYPTSCTAQEAARRTLLLNLVEDVPGAEETRQLYDDKFFRACFDLLLYPNCTMFSPEVIKVMLVEHAMLLHEYGSGGMNESIDRNVDDLSVVLISFISSLAYWRKQKLTLELFLQGANYPLMILDTGYFARGSCVCREGDIVALLGGCDHPVALRPDGNGNYKFVALLYVDGVMHGEAWPEDEAELVDIVLV